MTHLRPAKVRRAAMLLVLGMIMSAAAPVGNASAPAERGSNSLAIPVVTGLFPPNGPLAGGFLAIHGTGFAPTDVVRINGVVVASTFNAMLDIHDVVAPASLIHGPVQVTVTNGDGTSAETAASVYTYFLPPAITLLSPNSGPVGGGNTVTITGTNLLPSDLVMFGIDGPHTPTPVGPDQYSVVAPPGVLGTVNVEIFGLGGTSNLLPYTYVNVAAPTITSIDAPAAGPTGGGNTVTIKGTNLTGATTVSFGTTDVTSGITASATQLTVAAPAHAAGAVTIRVTTPGGTTSSTGDSTNTYTYVAAPTLTGIAAPAAGPTGGTNTVTINGTNLTGATTVSFGTTDVTSGITASANQLTVAAPPHAEGAVTIRVTTPGGTTSSTGDSTNTYRYVAAPSLTTLSPSVGRITGGETITISGSNLSGATAVTFGATTITGADITNITTSSLTITAPARSGTTSPVSVTVTTPGGTSAAMQYNYAEVPTISSLDPVSGALHGPTVVHIHGAAFGRFASDLLAVKFGTTNAAAVTWTSATMIVVEPPPMAAGPVNVTVTTVGGTSTSTATYTYLNPPTVEGLSPPNGPLTAGHEVWIAGTHLADVTAVHFDGIPGTQINPVSANSVIVKAPAHVAGAVAVTVTTPGGTSSATLNSANTYTYFAPPAITSLSRTSSTVAGGGTVTVTGTNLYAPLQSNLAADTPVVVSTNTATFTLKPGIAGIVQGTVTTPSGTSNAIPFTYNDPTPVISGVLPSPIPASSEPTVLRISGTNFGASATALAATIRTGQTTFNLTGLAFSATGISATAPGNLSPGAYEIVVTVNGMSSLPFPITVVPIKTTPPTLPGGRRNTAYSQAIGITSGNVSSATVTSGKLPTGLTLSNSGLLSGTPTEVGFFPLTIVATDSSSNQATANYNLSIDRELFFGAGNDGRFPGFVNNAVRTFGLGSVPPGGVLTSRSGPTGLITANALGGPLDGQTIAIGDVSGDGVDDVVLGTASYETAGPAVVVHDGVSGKPIAELHPYNSPGGVFVATGDVTGDGRADVITGPGIGFAGNVKVFDGVTRKEIKAFEAYTASFAGGVSVATGDINGDGVADIITGSASATSHVNVFDATTGQLLRSFLAFEPSFSGGIFVAAGDVTGDGYVDIITGAGPGSSPHVKVFSGVDGATVDSFLAFDPSHGGGVRVAAGDLNGDGRSEIITGPGPGTATMVTVYDGATKSAMLAGLAFGSTYTGGVFVAGPSTPAPQMVVESPQPGLQASATLSFGGWAFNPKAVTGSDVHSIDVWAYPATGARILLGTIKDANVGIRREDVARDHGGQFIDSGFSFTATQALPEGPYDVVFEARSLATKNIFVRRTVNVTIAPKAQLKFAIAGPGRAVAGQNVTYTMTVTNDGPATATGVVINTPAPPGTTLVGYTGCTTSFPLCAVGTLPPGSSTSRIVTATLHVPSNYAGTTLSYSGTASTTTPNSASVSSSIVTPVVPGPTVTSVNPLFGSSEGGYPVTIAGSNLDGATSVQFGKLSVPVTGTQSPNSVTVMAPASPAGGIVNVTVTTPLATTTNRVTFKYVGAVVEPGFLNFVMTTGSNEFVVTSQTPAQKLVASFNGTANADASPTWTASTHLSAPWLRVTNSGNSSGEFTVSVVNTPYTRPGHILSGRVVITNASLGVSATVPVTLTVSAAEPAAPIGSFDSPADGATVSGSIAVTGWALDDVGLDHVEIWRDAVGTEPGVKDNLADSDPRYGKVFIGKPTRVLNARPEVAELYPNHPNSDQAGWGYFMMTRGLTTTTGTFKLHAIAFDFDGLATVLGSKQITVDNSVAQLPFGSLDTPVEGSLVFGKFYSFGWAISPVVGCYITNVMYAIDSGVLSPVSYGDPRADVAAGNPGFTDSNAAGGHVEIDVSLLEPGLHSIGWLVTDSCGKTEGVGSRFFTVFRPVTTVSHQDTLPVAPAAAIVDVPAIPTDAPVEVRRVHETTQVEPSNTGVRVVRIAHGERVEFVLPRMSGESYVGFQLVNGERRALPAGSTLDGVEGIFYWQPGAAFLGAYDLEFVGSSGTVVHVQVMVR
jgi:hypothetical protein